MSRRHPIISITGSSGAGTTSVKKTFENIFRREKAAAAYIEADAFHGYTAEAVTDTILRRMPDYVHYICPQFAETDINFQRVPTVDTSNPFIARWIPTPDESMVVIRLKNPRGIDFPYLLSMIPHSFMSRANSIVIHGSKLDLAMQLILTPLILQLMERKRRTI